MADSPGRMKVTTTINRLHFGDLDPMRFEDLCLALIYGLHPWLDIRHYGRSGSENGVDIYARERLEDGAEREWLVQCRRYKKATKATFKKAVDDALAQAQKAPDVLLVVVACDVSRTAHESYDTYASKRGIATPLLWTASVIEARLHAERRDLLFTYFGISEAREARYRVATISRNIAIKKRLRKELLKDPSEVDPQKVLKRPHEKFRVSDVIIHSVDDESYPDADVNGTGISGWFALEIWDFYHNGLEFIFEIEYGVVDDSGRWSIIDHDETYDQSKYGRIKLLNLARIPYRNIVDFDALGDEYYAAPHIYCRFANGGTPYEGFRRVLEDDNYPRPMDPDLQFDIHQDG